MANIKTNAMRILDKEKIKYNTYEYDVADDHIDGISVAQKLNQPLHKVYKTLVTKGLNDYFVFVIPVNSELNLKACAKVVNQKKVEMIKVSDINKVTGYIRGGCSPIGMKKLYQTVIDESCKTLDTMIISGGKIGHQIELSPTDLINIVNANIEIITI